MRYFTWLFLLVSSVFGADGEWLRDVEMVPPTAYEVGAEIKRSGLFADRKRYWNDDAIGQFLLMYLGQETAGKVVKLEVIGADDGVVESAELPPLTQPKVALRLAVNRLAVGEYRLRATVPGIDPVEVGFVREDMSAPVVPFPREGVKLELMEHPLLTKTRWPMVIGVPMPVGAVMMPQMLHLQEDGKPVPAEFRVVGTWHPTAGDTPVSVRWVHVVFQAKYTDGKPAEYRIVMHAPVPGAVAMRRISVATTEDAFTVTTAKTRWQVNRKAFRGIDVAWYDKDGDGEFTQLEQLIMRRGDERQGPYLVDSRDIVFEAAQDENVEVIVEEQGAQRVVIRAEGWYTNNSLSDLAGKQLCRFVTRLTFWADRDEVQVDNRTILTFDTDERRLLDVGFAIPTQESTYAEAGLEGRSSASTFPKDRPVIVHQYRHDKARMINIPNQVKRPGEGAYREYDVSSADGWASVIYGKTELSPLILEDERTTLSIVSRYFRERFPRQLTLTNTGLTIHAWPSHGIVGYEAEEMYDRDQIYKLRWFHQGRLMDLRFPNEAYTALKQFHAEEQWDPEDMCGAAANGNAQGVALGSEFLIRIHPAFENMGKLSLVYEDNPTGRSDPAWNAATRVEGPVAPRASGGAFEAMEAEIDGAYPAYLRTVVERGGELGTFIYGNTHNKAIPERNSAHLHRVWQAAHYRQVWEPWFLMFRGNSLDILPWARAYSDRYMDVDTCNWADEETARIKWHVAGGMYHAKGFTPWGSKGFGQATGASYAGHQGHWINPTAFLIRYHMAGHLRSRDMSELWVSAMLSHKPYGGASRETGNTGCELFQHYQSTWNPDLIPIMNDMADGMLGREFAAWPAPYHHPWFNPFWFVHWHELTRDPRVLERVVEYCDGGKYGGSATMHAMMANDVGRKELLERYAGLYASMSKQIYRKDGDPLDGYRLRFISDPYTNRQQWPYWLYAAQQAGVAGLSAEAARRYYPTSSAHDWFIGSERAAVELLVLEEEDRDWSFTLESHSDTGPMSMRITDPKGKVLADKSLRTNEEGRKLRYRLDDILSLPVKKDGITGVYTLDIRTHMVNFLAPYTELLEASRLDSDRKYQVMGMDHYLTATGPVTLTYAAIKYRTAVSPNYLKISDANGRVITETSLLYSASRESIEVTLDPAQNPGPYHIESLGVGRIQWTGEAGTLLLAGTPEAATKLIGLMK